MRTKGRSGCIETESQASPLPLRDRTKRFAIRVIHLCRGVGGSQEGRVTVAQLIRVRNLGGGQLPCGCVAREAAEEFVAKAGIVIEEADECQFWLELILELRLAASCRR